MTPAKASLTRHQFRGLSAARRTTGNLVADACGHACGSLSLGNPIRTFRSSEADHSRGPVPDIVSFDDMTG
ncbi:MAG TPA: hypothetical protein VFV96_17655 [Verrucomicrobiae bacterium]|nr:hypothetical protein [Verrucomicrobiae bacterium]